MDGTFHRIAAGLVIGLIGGRWPPSLYLLRIRLRKILL